MISLLQNSIVGIDTVLLAVSPTIFIFSVTLLSDAIERSEKEEKFAKENEKDLIQKNLADLEATFKETKRNGDTADLEKKISSLRTQREESQRKIKQIRNKYESINFINTVVYPCAAIILVILLSSVSSMFVDSEVLKIFFLVLLLTVYAIYKILKSLDLIQKISSNKRESDHYTRLKETFEASLRDYYLSVKESVLIKFVNKDFPLNVSASSEIIIDFKACLNTGRLLQNSEMWFYIDDDIELINPPESESWRQSLNSSKPGLRTIKKPLGNLNPNMWVPRKIKIKSPAKPGKYKLAYHVVAEGFNGPIGEIAIIV